MNFLRTLVLLPASLLALAAACSSDDGGGDRGDKECPEGSRGCPCYGNGTCDSPLACDGTECGDAGSAGSAGSSSGGSGTGGMTGGSGGVTGGTAGTTGGGGTTQGGMGGSGGTPNGGSAESGAGGAGGNTGTGGGSCGDTMTDWQNCGACGRVCDNGGTRCASECCASGACTPAFGPCIREADGFATCAAACASIGESCVVGGCDFVPPIEGNTWRNWGLADMDRCETFGVETGSSGPTAACDTPLTWNANNYVRRCCCTDTH